MGLNTLDRPKEVESLPEGWRHHALSDGISLHSGHHVLARYCNTQGSGTPYLTGPADFPSGTIQQTKFTEKPAKLCEYGDILVTVKGSGSGNLVVSDGIYCISRQLMAIRVREWDRRFIYYSLLQNASQIQAASTGLIPGLSRFDVLEQVLPLPALPEQRAIAEALEDVDALLGAQEKLIAKKRDLKLAAMQQLLTGQHRLPGFQGEWEVKRFSEIALPRGERIDPRREGVQDFCVELEHIEQGSGRLAGSTVTDGQSSLKSIFGLATCYLASFARTFASIGSQIVAVFARLRFGLWWLIDEWLHQSSCFSWSKLSDSLKQRVQPTARTCRALTGTS